MLHSTIVRRRTYQLVADQLSELIARQQLRPGDLLPPEHALVSLYAVGRSSVREALRLLDSKGLIQRAPSGAFAVADVHGPLSESLDLLVKLAASDDTELFDVRRILESEAAGLAALRRADAQVDSMRDAIEEMVVGLGSKIEFIEADLRFHLIVAEATRNQVLTHLMNAIRTLLHSSLASSYHVPGSPERAIEMHRLILDSIESGRSEEARDRMTQHLTAVEATTRRRRDV